MQARIVAASRGARWLVEGWRTFRAAPLGWLGIVIGYVLLTQVIAMIPLVGAPAALVLVPPFTVGLMGAARAAAKGAPVQMNMLFDGFRHELRAQLALGMIYLVCTSLVVAATALADEAGVLRSIVAGELKAGELQLTDVLFPFSVFALVYAPVLMMFWFAPPLASWHATGVAKALFFSLFGCLMNWRAFLAYGAVIAMGMLGVSFIVFASSMLSAGGGARVPVAPLIVALLIVLPTLFASFYASYRDVFGTLE